MTANALRRSFMRTATRSSRCSTAFRKPPVPQDRHRFPTRRGCRAGTRMQKGQCGGQRDVQGHRDDRTQVLDQRRIDVVAVQRGAHDRHDPSDQPAADEPEGERGKDLDAELGDGGAQQLLDRGDVHGRCPQGLRGWWCGRVSRPRAAPDTNPGRRVACLTREARLGQSLVAVAGPARAYRTATDAIRTPGYLLPGTCDTDSITRSRLKLPGFWRGGNSRKLCSQFAT